MTEANEKISGSIRRHLWGAGLFLCALFVFLIVWSYFMPISGAVVASGEIVVESNVKKIQHKEGGIVKTIHVAEGDKVEAGDLLVTLDDATARANLAIIKTQLDELYATEARLLAERDDSETITFPDNLLERRKEPGVSSILNGQKMLMQARKAGMKGRKDQLKEQISQLGSQVKGLDVQQQAKVSELELITTELTGLEELLESSYVSANRVSAIKRDKTRLQGEHGSLETQIAQTNQAISEKRVRILQLDEDRRAEILEQLYQTRSEIARLSEQKLTIEDVLARTQIRSPRPGRVHQLQVHTKGGVLSPGEPIMLVVPEDEDLLIEAKVSPTDIDQLYPGQEARIRLPSFNRQTTPELRADIVTISAETTRDENTGASFYSIRLKLAAGEAAKLGDKILIPGMPVEVLIKTSDRTILSYLLKPISDQMTRALKEE